MTISPVKNAQANVLDWFVTPNQKGMIYLYMGDYKKAEQSFDDPNWKAVSCFYSEDFKCAQKEFAKVADTTAIYNMAVSAGQDGRFKTARELYQGLLAIEPDNKAAKFNLEKVNKIIKEINDFNKGQLDEHPKPPSKAPPKEAKEIADGAKKKGIGIIPRST
ncbi:hypothetical protein L0B53_03940 [Vibrio sp. SS-MA-C1-2]|uniref:tetratricopeptide repeat protein n=1 Tax=Vibrio sp. SS-MA-C1-2 TaxID=2908646 RepID=UPI001F2C853B|nr:hypothetical protein [Vibrio sp. SS-MA-C1-2]UJF17084.1 hypothetical protein L0B53_03940 [Vibrio sp. SS-MA-C1-2]